MIEDWIMRLLVVVWLCMGGLLVFCIIGLVIALINGTFLGIPA